MKTSPFNLHLLCCYIITGIVLPFSLQAKPARALNGMLKADSALVAHDSLSRSLDLLDLAARALHKIPTKESDIPVLKQPGKVYLSAIPGVIYALQTGYAPIVGINASFYTDKSTDENISTIIAFPEYTQLHQLILPVILNIWSKNNRLNWQGDYRYFKYPSYTYGLGGHTSFAEGNLLDYSYLRAYQEVLRQVATDLFIGSGLALDYHWNIKELSTADALPNNDFKLYGDGSTTIASGILFNVLYDNRRNQNNPQGGFYGNITYRPNFTVMGSTHNSQMLQVEFRKYIKLSPHRHSILAFWNLNWFTFGGKVPYLDLPSSGWDTYENLGRGYVQGRYRGTNMLYLEGEFRFQITNNGLLGGVLFSNAQMVSNYPANRFNNVLPAAGAGLRIKFNKRSNTNMAIDYGFGVQGSQGLFLNLAEVF